MKQGQKDKPTKRHIGKQTHRQTNTHYIKTKKRRKYTQVAKSRMSQIIILLEKTIFKERKLN